MAVLYEPVVIQGCEMLADEEGPARRAVPDTEVRKLRAQAPEDAGIGHAGKYCLAINDAGYDASGDGIRVGHFFNTRWLLNRD